MKIIETYLRKDMRVILERDGMQLGFVPEKRYISAIFIVWSLQ